MSSLLKATVVFVHPHRQKIIECILATKCIIERHSSRLISKHDVKNLNFCYNLSLEETEGRSE